jgi:glycosyltransferase involved in cell wall biosynthesis
MKKVLLEFEKIKDLHSGLGQYCFHLGNELLHIPTNLEYLFFLPKDNFGIFGKDQRYIASSKYKRLSSVFAPKADLFHAIHQDSKYPPTAGSKYLLTIHDLNFLFKGHKDPKPLLQNLQNKIDRACHVVFISEFTKNICLEHLKFSQDKYSVIYNGISLSYRRKWQTDQISNIQPQRPFLFTIGIISEKKNFHVLIPMMKQLPDYDLIIAGRNDSPYAQEMQAELVKHGLQDRVKLIGNITEDQKIKYYQSCSGFVFPSKQEGFGMPVIEAMSLGKPVFVSTFTSLPEITGPHGFYFDNFDPDHMSEVIKIGLNKFEINPDSKEKTKKWTERFSWEKTAQAYLKLYQSL